MGCVGEMDCWWRGKIVGACCDFGDWAILESGGCRLVRLGGELELGWAKMLKRSASLRGGTGVTEAVRGCV